MQDHERPHYDPDTQRVSIPPDASPYQRAHELAHAAQQQHRTWRWRLQERTAAWPYLARIARALVEWEAATLAVHSLALAGLCDRGVRLEARRDKWAYLRSIFWP